TAIEPTPEGEYAVEVGDLVTIQPLSGPGTSGEEVAETQPDDEPAPVPGPEPSPEPSTVPGGDPVAEPRAEPSVEADPPVPPTVITPRVPSVEEAERLGTLTIVSNVADAIVYLDGVV